MAAWIVLGEAGGIEPVGAQALELIPELGIVGDDGPGIAVGTQVLSGVEGKATDVPKGADLGITPAGPEGLRAILDHAQFACPGDRKDCVHVRAVAVQMDRENAAGAFGDGRLDQERIHG